MIRTCKQPYGGLSLVQHCKVYGTDNRKVFSLRMPLLIVALKITLFSHVERPTLSPLELYSGSGSATFGP